MNKKTLNALNKSIQKWERFATNTTKQTDQLGPAGCPLCALFYSNCCDGCPVAAKTNKKWCRDTPYDAIEELNYEINIESPEFRRIAKRELKFLKSLLPSGGAK